MATRFNSATALVDAVKTVTVLTATTDVVVNSLVAYGSTANTLFVKVLKSGAASAVTLYKPTANGEILEQTVALENGDQLLVDCTAYTSSTEFICSYAYESNSYAGESVGVHNDVNLTGLADGDVLIYNASSGDFEPGAYSGGGGGGGGVGFYEHTQSVSSASWSVTHNLNTSNPQVVVVDSTGEVVEPQSINVTSANALTITLASAATGTASVVGGTGSTAISNMVFVGQKSDFPTPSAGVITLGANVTYFITDDIDLTGDRLVGAANTTIIGGSSENCKITSTGLTAGVALFTTEWTTPIRHVTFYDVDTAIAINGVTNAPVALDWTGMNFLNVPNIGTISTCDNFIYSKGAFLNSRGLVFDGTVGTIGLDNSIFVGDGSAGSLIEVAPTATVTRRFRTIYCSVVAFGSTTGIDVDSLATIPVEGFILDTVNFSGGSTYLPDIDHTSNSSRFENCKGVTNTSVNGQMYMQGNSTSTTISSSSTFYKVSGTTTASADNAKFTHTSNRLTCNATVPRKFMLIAHLSFIATNNTDIEFGFYDSTLAAVRTPSRTVVTADTGPAAQQVSFSCVTTLEDTDYIEVHCANNTDTTSVTVKNLNVLITEV